MTDSGGPWDALRHRCDTRVIAISSGPVREYGMIQSSGGKNATQYHFKIRSHVVEILRDDPGVTQGKGFVL